MGNDLAYVVQAVVGFSALCEVTTETDAGQAPNFVWKTTAFPAARNGYLWSIVLQILLSKFQWISSKKREAC
jgi:ACS family pantothenate transporter-like MFS transporter